MEVSEKPNYVGSPAVIDSASEFSADQRDMQRMGKKQEFKRNFNWFSSVAFTSCTMGTWEFVFINNFQGLVDGGRAGTFWGYCWVILGQFFVVLSLAEMSSMAPTAGGQSVLLSITGKGSKGIVQGSMFADSAAGIIGSPNSRPSQYRRFRAMHPGGSVHCAGSHSCLLTASLPPSC
jgi:hypothetical protein